MSMGIAVMMIVLAMLVMVMMMVVMAMIMRGMIMTGVGMRMGFGVRMGLRMRVRFGIGAAFGIERRVDLDHAGAQPLQHRLDDMIAPDPQALWHDLRRQMTVAEMPGKANQMLRIGGPDLGQGLGCRDHLDQPAIVEHQSVAATKCYGIFQIEQEFQSARAGHRHSPPVAVVEIEHHGIGRRLTPVMLATYLGGADLV